MGDNKVCGRIGPDLSLYLELVPRLTLAEGKTRQGFPWEKLSSCNTARFLTHYAGIRAASTALVCASLHRSHGIIRSSHLRSIQPLHQLRRETFVVSRVESRIMRSPILSLTAGLSSKLDTRISPG